MVAVGQTAASGALWVAVTGIPCQAPSTVIFGTLFPESLESAFPAHPTFLWAAWDPLMNVLICLIGQSILSCSQLEALT